MYARIKACALRELPNNCNFPLLDARFAVCECPHDVKTGKQRIRTSRVNKIHRPGRRRMPYAFPYIRSILYARKREPAYSTPLRRRSYVSVLVASRSNDIVRTGTKAVPVFRCNFPHWESRAGFSSGAYTARFAGDRKDEIVGRVTTCAVTKRIAASDAKRRKFRFSFSNMYQKCASRFTDRRVFAGHHHAHAFHYARERFYVRRISLLSRTKVIRLRIMCRSTYT